MSCVLRVSGTEFDVDDFIEKSKWRELLGDELEVYRTGEYTNRLKTHKYEHNGFGVLVGDIGFDDFEEQQEYALRFIGKYKAGLELLSTYKTDGWHCFDFGLDTNPPNNFSRTHRVQPALMKVLGELGFDMHISNYFPRQDKMIRRIKRKRWWPFKKKEWT